MSVNTAAESERAGRPGWIARLGLENPRRLVWWAIAVGTAVRVASAMLYGFGYDEGYYLATARHFALSYFDHPPLSIWIVSATMELTGSESPLVLRLPFIAMFAVTVWLTYRLGARLFGEPAGAFAALLLSVSPVFTAMAGVWMRPDGPLMLFLVAALLAMARIATAPEGERHTGLWAASGLFLGLAMLAKYHAVLIAAGLVLFALSSRAHRRWFREPGPYVAALTALAVFAPVLVWNAANEWVSLGFQAARINGDTGLHPEWLLRMVLGQIAYIGPWVWLPMVPALWWALRRGRADSGGWLLVCVAILPVLVFTAAALWSPVGWLFHWQAPGYLMLFPLLGAATARWAVRAPGAVNLWLGGSAAVTIALVAVLSTQAATGWLRDVVPAGLTKGLSGAVDPTLEGHAWPELRDALAEQGFLDRDQTFAVTAMWPVTGKVDVEIGAAMPVVCLCEDPQNIAFGWDHTGFAGWDAIIVDAFDHLDDPAAAYAPYFDSIEPIGPVRIYRGATPELELTVLFATNYNGAYPLALPP